jgi:hypothetical protein
MERRERVLLRLLMCVVGLVCADPATGQSFWHTCGNPMGSSSAYPVIVYDANEPNEAVLAYRDAVLALIDRYKGQHEPIPHNEIAALNPENLQPSFLCDGRTVEVYILNRKFKSNYSVTLTLAVKSETGHPETAGYSQSSASAPAASSAPSTPSTKGFAPIATGTNLLTTDQIIADFLNEEYFDRPVAKIMDDASAVTAQANQFRNNIEGYLAALRSINDATPADEGNATLQRVADEFDTLARDVNIALVNDKTFNDWTERADRLQADVARVNTKLQGYPVVDTLVNLRASAAILNDNVRGVRNEFVSLALARNILRTLIDQYHGTDALPPYLRERATAEIRILLRSQYPGTTIDDLTLARIMDAYKPSSIGWLALRERIASLRVDRLMQSWTQELNAPLTRPLGPVGPDALCANPCLAPFTPDDPVLPVSINLSPGLDYASAVLESLRDGIRRMNNAEARVFEAINNLYDRAVDTYQVLPLNLTGYRGNLFVYYMIGSSSGFYRYRFINETPQPVSACTLALAANTNVSGGELTCATAPAVAIPAASASFAANVPTSAAPATAASPTPAPAPATGASASGGSGTASPSAVQPSTGGSSATAQQIQCPVDFCGHFELHHFQNAALITGAAYDSIPNPSFSWFMCPTSSAIPGGNPPLMTPSTGGSLLLTSGSCISPSGGTTALPTYYQLMQSKQTQLAIIQGISVYFRPQDSFTRYTRDGHTWRMSPGLFLGAAVWPLNHYYAGLSAEPFRAGISIVAGYAAGVVNRLPRNYGFVPNDVVMSNSTPPTPPALSTSTTLRGGWFVMVGFHTSLFKAIFTGTAFQNPGNIGTAGSSNVSQTQ